MTSVLAPSSPQFAGYAHCPPLAFADLDIVIPALNEEHRIGRTVFETCRHLETVGFFARLIVVDNGCVDATAEAVDAARSANIPAEVIGCARRGKGAAVKAGIQYSQARYVAYCDADLSTPPSLLTEAYVRLEQGFDAVIGSRRCAGAEYATQQPWYRRIGSVAFSFAARGMIDGVRDTQCGFKAFRSDVAKKVFAPLVTDGFAFDVEVIARLQRAGHRITELPISWHDQDGSSFRPLNDGVRAFRELLSARQALRLAAD